MCVKCVRWLSVQCQSLTHVMCVCVCVSDTNDDSIVVTTQTSLHTCSSSSTASWYTITSSQYTNTTTTSHTHSSVPFHTSSTHLDYRWGCCDYEFTETFIIVTVAASVSVITRCRSCGSDTYIQFLTQVVSGVGSHGSTVGQSWSSSDHSETDTIDHRHQTESLPWCRRRDTTD